MAGRQLIVFLNCHLPANWVSAADMGALYDISQMMKRFGGGDQRHPDFMAAPTRDQRDGDDRWRIFED